MTEVYPQPASPTPCRADFLSRRDLVVYQSLVSALQTLIVVVVAYAADARFGSPALGIPLTVVAAMLLTVVFAALSNAVALLVRQQEALIGVSQLLSLPLTFLSSAIMATALMPTWMQTHVVAGDKGVRGIPEVGLTMGLGGTATLASAACRRASRPGRRPAHTRRERPCTSRPNTTWLTASSSAGSRSATFPESCGRPRRHRDRHRHR